MVRRIISEVRETFLQAPVLGALASQSRAASTTGILETKEKGENS
jgi:hypothetical protein